MEVILGATWSAFLVHRKDSHECKKQQSLSQSPQMEVIPFREQLEIDGRNPFYASGWLPSPANFSLLFH